VTSVDKRLGKASFYKTKTKNSNKYRSGRSQVCVRPNAFVPDCWIERKGRKGKDLIYMAGILIKRTEAKAFVYWVSI